MKCVLSRRVTYISLFIISTFMAFYWWQIQVTRVGALAHETQVRADIENEFRYIDELTLKLHEKVSVQEIKTAENIDAKQKSDLIQFRETYLRASATSSKITVIRQYLVVVQQILIDMKPNRKICADRVCISYTQYVNTFVIFKERYKASVNKIITKQTSLVFKNHLHKAFDIE